MANWKNACELPCLLLLDTFVKLCITANSHLNFNSLLQFTNQVKSSLCNKVLQLSLALKMFSCALKHSLRQWFSLILSNKFSSDISSHKGLRHELAERKI